VHRWHIQRESLQWLTKHPQSQAGYELKDIIKRLHTIDNRDKWGYWVDMVKWYKRHEGFVNAKTFKKVTKNENLNYSASLQNFVPPISCTEYNNYSSKKHQLFFASLP
jgi:hypothetical protein